MSKTIIDKLADFGQSIWLDNLSRCLIESGKLKELAQMGVRGVTSNPAIFDKAISQSNDYDQRIAQLAKEGKSTFEIYDQLTVKDVQEAADIFLSVYEKTRCLDGYVSLEVNPQLAHSVRETIAEGKRLWKKVNRPNLMLKVPATEAGFSAIEELLAEGMNVNATLIFSEEQYSKTAQAYVRGIKRLEEKKGDLAAAHSVASVFVSRIDTAVDALLDEASGLKGRAAAANTNLIFKKSREIFSSQEFRELKSKGANVQRPLWASTGTKNPAYSPIKYVRELIAQGTVNTMPDNTLEAFLKSQEVKEALTVDASGAVAAIDRLKALGIDINAVCATLLKDGLAQFENSFDSLLKAIEKKSQSVPAYSSPEQSRPRMIKRPIPTKLSGFS